MTSTRIWSAAALSVAAIAGLPCVAFAAPATAGGAAHLEAHAAVNADGAMRAARGAHSHAMALIARAQKQLGSAEQMTVSLEHNSAVDGGVAGASAAAAFDSAASVDSSKMALIVGHSTVAVDRVAERAMANDLKLEADVSLSYAGAWQGTPPPSDTQGQLQGSMDTQMTALEQTVGRVKTVLAQVGTRVFDGALSAAANAEGQLSNAQSSIQAPGGGDASASAGVSAQSSDSPTAASSDGTSSGTSSGSVPSLTVAGQGSGSLTARR
jgi:hypothetical protein